MLLLGAHAESGAAPHVVVLRSPAGRIMHADVQQMDAALILGIEPAHVRERPLGLHHHRDAVQIVVARVKDVPAQTAAPKCLSNALTRSPAIDCGLRPSIWCR